jgi:hypothetical protein
MDTRQERIAKLREAIDRQEIMILDRRKALDTQNLDFAAFNLRLKACRTQIEHDKAHLRELQAEVTVARDPPVSATPPAIDGPWDVFISYTRTDETAVQEVYDQMSKVLWSGRTFITFATRPAGRWR